MRRSTAAAIGTFTGAALIMGARLSVAAPPQAAPPSFDLSQSDAGQGAAAGGTPKPKPAPSRKAPGRQGDAQDTARDGGRGAEGDEAARDGEGTPEPTGKPTRKPTEKPTEEATEEPPEEPAEEPAEEPTRESNGWKDGEFTGGAVSNPYGRVQVAITVSDGRITAVAVSAPNSGRSADINARAVPALKQQTLNNQSAEVDAVSGATFTSRSYAESLQGAVDAARG